MLQALMADRLQLKIHKETKGMPVHALVVDKKGSRLVIHTAEEPQTCGGYGSLSVKKRGTGWLASWLSQQLLVIDNVEKPSAN
jgi:uncharacterized protein (TIGR03435 family)